MTGSSGAGDDALTMLWATPILKRQLLTGDRLRVANEEIYEAVMTGFKQWRSEAEVRGEKLCHTSSSASGVNERFFRMQQALYNDGKAVWAPLRDSVAAQQLRRAIFQNVRAYLEAASASDSSDGGQGDSRQDGIGSPDDLFVWATVHQACIGHLPHVHESSQASGVYYVSAPPGSGALVLEDPRGPRPPFTNRVINRPREGLLIIFPPWLSHHVTATCQQPPHQKPQQQQQQQQQPPQGQWAGESRPRISLSFNLPGSWTKTSDASFVAGEL